MSSSSGAIRPSRFIRPISSPCLRRLGTPPTDRCRSGASSQGQFMSAPIARIARHRYRQHPRPPRPRSAVGLAARHWFIWSRLRWLCRRRSGRPVKIVMTREEVFRATVRHQAAYRGQARSQERRRHRRRRARAQISGRRLSGSPVQPGCMCGFAMYDLPNVQITGYDVVANRPKMAAYRAPGRADLVVWGRELHRRAGPRVKMDPIAAAREERGRRGHQGGARADLD